MAYINKLINKNSIQNFFIENVLLLFFGYDFLIKIIVHYTEISLFYNYVIVFKVLLVSIILLQYGFRKINTIYLLPAIGLIIAYTITQLSNYYQMSLDDIHFNGYYFLSSITSIVFMLFLSNIDATTVKIQISRLLWFLSVSSLFILIGYLFEIEVFRSYFRGGRFGYSGFLLYHHEAGFIFFIFINLLYFRLKKEKSRINFFLFLFVLMVSLLVGTKKTLFFTAIFFIYLLIDNIKNIKTLLFAALSGILGVFIFYDSLNKYYILFSKIYKEDGFWSSFLSYRNILFNEKFYPYIIEEGSVLNTIFGWPFFNNHRTEMELFDLFLFFGFIGLVCYIILFFQLLKGKSRLTYFMVISLIIGTLFSGNLLASVNVMLMMYLAIRYINSKEKV